MVRSAIVLSCVMLGGAVPAGAADKPASAAEVKKAIVVLRPTEGNKAEGTITFTRNDKDDVVHVSGEISGLTAGPHGFHVHEWGDCSSKDGSSAGNHFNPTNNPHGAPTAAERHAGDLGNVNADDSGKAKVELDDRVLQLNGERSIVGRSVIVHGKADDLKTQPSGDAGPRLACGVVGVAKP
jgi:Cu-Zn family superoxide dismutase